MVDQPSSGSGPPNPADLEAVRKQLRRDQAVWGREPPIGPADLEPSPAVLASALGRADQREAEAARDGEFIRAGPWKYPADGEQARWARTREILHRVAPGPFEDPIFLEMLA